MDLGALVYKIEVDAREAVRQVDGFANKTLTAAKEVGTAAKQTSAAFTDISRTSRQAFIVVAGAITGAIYASAKFEKEMANIATALRGPTMASFDMLRESILKMSIAHGEATASLSAGLYKILTAGISAADAIKILDASAELADAGLTSTATAANIVTSAIKAYGLAASDAADITDILMVTALQGKTSIDELGGTLGNLLPIAAALGVSLEEIGTVLATVTRQGIETSTAVMGMNIMMKAFLAPQKEAVAVAKEYGIELSAAWLKVNGFAGAVRQLQGATEEEITSIFGNARALKVVIPLMSDLTGLTKIQEEMMNRSGITMEAHNKQVQTLSFQFGQLKQASMALLISFGDMFSESIKGANIFTMLTAVISTFANILQSIPTPLKVILAVVGGLLVALTGFGTVAGFVAGQLMTLRIAFQLLAAGMGATTMELALMTGGLTLALGLLAIGITGLMGGFKGMKSSARDYSVEASKLADDTHKQRVEIDELVKRYETLKNKLNSSTLSVGDREKAEKDLQEVLIRLNQIMPGYIDQWDKSGKALGFSTEAAKAKTEELKAREKETLERARDAAEKEVRVETEKLNDLKSARNQELVDYKIYRTLKEEILKELQSPVTMPEIPVSEINPFEPTHIDTGAIKDTGVLRAELERLEGVLTDLGGIGKEYEGQLDKVAAAQQRLDDTTRKLNTGYEDYDDTIKKIVQDEQESDRLIKRWISNWEKYDEAMADIDPTVEQLKAKIAELNEQFIIENASGKDVTETIKAIIEAQKNLTSTVKEQTDEYKKNLETRIDNLRKYEGVSINSAIAILDNEIAALDSGDARYKIAMDYRTKLVEEQKGKITAIWDQVNQSFKDGMVNLVETALTDIHDLESAFQSMGDSIIASFKKAFAESLVEKMGFDNILNGNILDIGGMFSGLGNTITGTFNSIFGTAAGMPGVDVFEPIAGETMASVLPTAAESAAASAGTTAVTAPAMTTPPGLILAAFAVSAKGFVSAIEDINRAFRGGEDQAAYFGRAITSAVSPITSLFGGQTQRYGLEGARAGANIAGENKEISSLALALVSPITGLLNQLTGGFIGKVAGGVIGSGVGMITSGLEKVGLVKRATPWEQYMAQDVRAVREGNMTIEELHRRTYQRMSNYSTDHWENEDSMLEKSLAERAQYYKALESLGMFSEQQLAEYRNVLRLPETGGDYFDAEGKAAQAGAAAVTTARKEMEEAMYALVDANWQLSDDVGGWAEAWDAAWARMPKSVEEFRSFYEEAMQSMGMSTEGIAAALEVFDKQIGTTSEMFRDFGGEMNAELEKMAAYTAQNLRASGAEWDSFSQQAQQAMNMFLGGWGDTDKLKEQLLQIQGMTEPMASYLLKQAESMKELGQTDFTFGDAFSDEMGKLMSMNFDEFAKMIRSKFGNIGRLAGKEFKDGIGAGASGSGFLGKVLYDNTKMETQVNRYYYDLGIMSGETFYAAVSEPDYDITVGVRETGITTILNRLRNLTGQDWRVKLATLANVPSYQYGTNYHPGGYAIVGEAGAELVNLPKGSQVIPDISAASRGNITIPVTINTGNIGNETDLLVFKKELERSLGKTVKQAIDIYR